MHILPTLKCKCLQPFDFTSNPFFRRLLLHLYIKLIINVVVVVVTVVVVFVFVVVVVVVVVVACFVRTAGSGTASIPYYTGRP